ncbi:MAG TPA: ribulose-phosphate 3-epimerase [Bacteroidota bacterium]|nr:ribulose-phosphate 3-epimerase [Bacteroidota bacterium]HRT67200.1 ribulose-phosphate 3-epimerase [Bacteroidota bacterium]
MSNNKIKIAPSLLSANFANLESDIKKCELGGADMLHLDVMDGHFVPNLTFGPLIFKDIKKCTKLPISTHLMVENPDNLIPEFAQLGSEYISFHVEAVRHIHRSISLIKSYGKKAGIALNPATPLEYAYTAAEFVDFILLMSVNPGFGGQEFIDNFYRRANLLKEFLLKENLKVMIEVDGGVKIENVKQIVDAGADILVSGSGIFEGNIIENIKKMRETII